MELRYYFVYLLIINLVAFLITGLDKYYAINDYRRVSEKNLFSIAAVGGAVFMFLSMCMFRHKTRHLRFMIGLPAIIFAHFIITFILIYQGVLY